MTAVWVSLTVHNSQVYKANTTVRACRISRKLGLYELLKTIIYISPSIRLVSLAVFGSRAGLEN